MLRSVGVELCIPECCCGAAARWEARQRALPAVSSAPLQRGQASHGCLRRCAAPLTPATALPPQLAAARGNSQPCTRARGALTGCATVARCIGGATDHYCGTGSRSYLNRGCGRQEVTPASASSKHAPTLALHCIHHSSPAHSSLPCIYTQACTCNITPS